MSKRIVSVDVQPQYLDHLNRHEFDIHKYCEYINSSSEIMPVSFIFNEYTHGVEISEKKYKKWLLSIGIRKSIITNVSTVFLGKSYSFISPLYNTVGTSKTLKLLRFMLKNQILFTSDIGEEEITKIIKPNKFDEIYLDLYIPDEILSFIKDTEEDIVFVGGGRFECLKEIELLAKLLKKKYIINDELTYGKSVVGITFEEMCKF
jgi:hypothetical protein